MNTTAMTLSFVGAGIGFALVGILLQLKRIADALEQAEAVEQPDTALIGRQML